MKSHAPHAAPPDNKRRDFLRHAAAVGACSAGLPAARGQTAAWASPSPLAPMRASADRIIAVSVCTRPFRAAGPRIEVERIGPKTVVHNYGHGGSGWSLSWGSAAAALELIQATRARRIAVIGCGAIGLTTAVAAQRAGLRVRIYAKERPPDVRSSLASGVWSPDSRICTEEQATPAFRQRWERMARESWRMYQHLLGLPGQPVEWCSGYALADDPGPPSYSDPVEPPYPELEYDLLSDLHPRSQLLAPHEHPFAVTRVRRYTQLVFNLSAYARLLMDDFLQAGGQIETRTFNHPRDLVQLPESTIVNATGYGARALFSDASIVPVRGQTARLVPQPEANYGLVFPQRNLFVVSRHDGILVQAQAPGDFGNADTTPDRAASEAAVARLAALFPPLQNGR